MTNNSDILNEAIAGFDVEAITTLLKTDIDVNIPGEKSNYTPLETAAYNGFFWAVQQLRAKGAKVLQRDDALCGPLHLAAIQTLEKSRLFVDYHSTMEFILSAGGSADVNRVAQGEIAESSHNIGNAPLHIAVKAGSKSLVKLLTKYGANPNQLGNGDFVPLMYTHSYDMMELLINSGATVSKKQGASVAPLHHFIAEGPQGMFDVSYKKRLTLLLGRSNVKDLITNISWNGHKGVNPLHIAILQGGQGRVEELLKRYPDANIEDADNRSPLQLAGETFNIAIISSLIKHGANVGYKGDATAESLLEKALKNGKKDVVKLLLNNGALLFYDADNLPDLTGYSLKNVPVPSEISRPKLQESGAKNVQDCVYVPKESILKNPVWKRQRGYALKQKEKFESTHVTATVAEEPEKPLIDFSEPVEQLATAFDALKSLTRTRSVGEGLHKFNQYIRPSSIKERSQSFVRQSSSSYERMH